MLHSVSLRDYDAILSLAQLYRTVPKTLTTKSTVRIIAARHQERCCSQSLLSGELGMREFVQASADCGYGSLQTEIRAIRVRERWNGEPT
jgi:hypothetical protein